MKHLNIFLLALSTAFLTWSCIDQEFDVPPTQGVSDLEANRTIAEVKELHRSGQTISIDEDIIIAGKIISDDTEGNFFKQIILQDETGGIAVQINQNNLQSVYQRNRIVYVKCKGLGVGDYGGFIQLGLPEKDGDVGRIPELMVPEFIEKGPIESPVEPKEVLISNISLDDVGTLLKFKEVEFSRDDYEQPYADENNSLGSGTNRLLEDCLGGRLIVRTSIYADFKDELTPFFNGEVVGVLTVFNNDYQLAIRDPEDVTMSAPPCNRSSTAPVLVSLAELRASFEGGNPVIADGKYISGTVISDVDAGNMTNRNLAIQDATGGIIIRFESGHSFQPNDILEIEVSGLIMEEFQGLLQVSSVPSNRAKFITPGAPVTPLTITIGDLLNDFENLESTLVEIKGAEFTSGSTFNGSVSVEDGSGSITMYTRSAAEFATELLPSGKVDIIAIVTQGGTTEVEQLSIRTRDDVSGGSTNPGGGDTLDVLFEDFESLNDFDPVVLKGWQNVAQKGDRVWQAKEFSNNIYAQATAFNDTSPEMETWLITPSLNMDVISTMNFETAMAFHNHDGLTVWIATDFDGTDVSGANWQQLNAVIATSTDGDHNWVPSGNVDLSSFSGIAHIAFRHEGNSASATTSYRIDNIDIK